MKQKIRFPAVVNKETNTDKHVSRMTVNPNKINEQLYTAVVGG